MIIRLRYDQILIDFIQFYSVKIENIKNVV